MNATCNYDDPIDEVYAVRRRIAEKYNYDLDLIFEAAAARQRAEEANGVRYVRLPIARHTPAVV